MVITGRILKTLIKANKPIPVLFRHGTMVWVESDDHGRPVFREITQDKMRALLARLFRWYRKNIAGYEVPTFPPLEGIREELLRAIHGAGAFRNFKDTLQRYGKLRCAGRGA